MKRILLLSILFLSSQVSLSFGAEGTTHFAKRTIGAVYPFLEEASGLTLKRIRTESTPLVSTIKGTDDSLVAERKDRYASAKKANAVEISTHTEIMPTIKKLSDSYGPENVWVVWDIDDCVTYPVHPACLPTSYAKKYKSIFEEMTRHLTPVQISIVWNLKYRDCENSLTDKEIISILNDLKGRKIPTLGLTASMAGAVKDEDDIQHQARFEKLRELGVQFNFSPIKEDEIQFTELPIFHASHPVFYKGIGFSQLSGLYGSATKGEFLLTLIDTVGEQPKALILVDDSERNLTHVEHDLSAKGIEVHTFKFRSEKVHEEHELSEEEYRSYISTLIERALSATKRRAGDTTEIMA